VGTGPSIGLDVENCPIVDVSILAVTWLILMVCDRPFLSVKVISNLSSLAALFVCEIVSATNFSDMLTSTRIGLKVNTYLEKRYGMTATAVA
jgi:hypothetical protein